MPIRESNYEQAIAELARRGCGAWVGRGQCPATTPTTHVWGGTDLSFATYLSASEKNGLVHAFVCDRHNPGEGVVNDALIADMDAELLRDQRAEYRSFYAMTTMEPPVVDLLHPPGRFGVGKAVR